jgi:hypothetical protein
VPVTAQAELVEVDELELVVEVIDVEELEVDVVDALSEDDVAVAEPVVDALVEDDVAVAEPDVALEDEEEECVSADPEVEGLPVAAPE